MGAVKLAEFIPLKAREFEPTVEHVVTGWCFGMEENRRGKVSINVRTLSPGFESEHRKRACLAPTRSKNAESQSIPRIEMLHEILGLKNASASLLHGPWEFIRHQF